MTLHDILNKGPKRVRHIEGVEFMLSVIRGYAGVIAIGPHAIGDRCPKPGRHRMLPAWEREEWLAQLDLVP